MNLRGLRSPGRSPAGSCGRRPWRCALPALLLVAAGVAAQAGDMPLRPGERREFDLVTPDGAADAGPGVRRLVLLQPAGDGPLTVLVESLDGDVLVRLLDAAGVVVAEDDDGGVEGNARLELSDARQAQELRLEVSLKRVSAGRLTVEVCEGSLPLLEGLELARARGQFLEARGRQRMEHGDDKGAASDLLNAGLAYLGGGLNTLALAPLQSAAAPIERRGDTLRLAFAHGLLACATYRVGRVGEALPLLESAAREAATVKQAPLEMMVTSDLATACRDLGRHDDSGRHLERALELARQTGSRPDEVTLLTQRARLQLQLGRPAVALDALAEAGRLADELGLPPLRFEVSATRGTCLMLVGDPSGARRLFEEALDMPAPPLRLASVRGELAGANLATGNILRASSLYRVVADAAVALGDASLLATATLGQGLARVEMGDTAGAREAFESALATWGDDGPPDNVAIALLQLTRLEADAGRRPEAERQLVRLQALASGERSSTTIRSLSFSAAEHVAFVAGDFVAALVMAERRHSLWKEAGATFQEALAARDVANENLRLGRTEEAASIALQALESLRSLQRTREALHPLNTLTECALRRGDSALAARWLAEALAAQRASATDANGQLDSTLQAALRSGNTEATPGQLVHDLAALRVRQAGGDSAARTQAIEAGLLASGEWKGFELATGLAQRASAGGAQRLALLAEHENTLSERDLAKAGLLRAVAAGAEDADVAALTGGIADLAVHAAELEARIHALPAATAPDSAAPRASLAALRAALGAGALYVEYAESVERLYAYVVSPTRADLLDLGPLPERSAQVARFVAGISDPAALADVATLARDGRALHAALLEPALALADAPDARLHVVPCAAVAALPFEALVVQAPHAPSGFADLVYEIDRREVAYAPSGPVFIQMQRAAPRAALGRALVLGDPVYPPATEGATPRGSRDPRNLGFVRLPGTRDEALALAVRLLDAHSGDGASPDELLAPARLTDDATLDVGGLRLLLGGAAAAGALRGDLREFALIHCATHGHVDPHDPRLTGLALTPAGGDDGFVTLGDVAELSLDADLAVLSACETGRGGERRGEGTQSLARAFLHAGARGVVSSLWQVDDRETERTMAAFYEGLADKGLTAGAALREARLAVRHAPASPDAFRGTGRGKLLAGAQAPAAVAGRGDLAGHPYFWAAFTYVGPSGLRPLAVR